MYVTPPYSISRRDLLAGIAVAAGVGATLGSTGCSVSRGKRLKLSVAPLRQLGGAVTVALQTLTSAPDAALSGSKLGNSSTAIAQNLKTNHEAHLSALRNRLGSVRFVTPSDPSTVPDDARARVIERQRWVGAIAAQRCVDLPLIDAGAASRLVDSIALFGSIAACQATHLVLLGEGSPKPSAGWGLTSGSRTPISALQAALSSEHATIYGYGALGAHLPDQQRDQALAAIATHRDRRDSLAAVVTAQGHTAVSAESSYQLPHAIHDEREARELAIRLEDSCGAYWRALLNQTMGGNRSVALAALTDCAVQATRWRSRSGARLPAVAFPGR